MQISQRSHLAQQSDPLRGRGGRAGGQATPQRVEVTISGNPKFRSKPLVLQYRSEGKGKKEAPLDEIKIRFLAGKEFP